MKLLVAVVLLAVAGCHSERLGPHPMSDEFIQLLNDKASTWTAGRNFDERISLNKIKSLLGRKVSKENGLPLKTFPTEELQTLPKEFDSRKEWPHCKTMFEIRDQSDCGSCWAISSASVMSDRQCVHKQGEYLHYSVEDINSCCDYCGDGCGGGEEAQAFRYWQRSGVVSGGQYGSKSGCQPYTLEPCEHHVDGPLPSCNNFNFTTPPCKNSCIADYNRTYSEDKHFAKDVYALEGEAHFMKDIVENGPITTFFVVFEDFVHYKSGVYQHTSGSRLGEHAVKILGYGEENGTKYWLIANSWNTSWGDKGYFKIRRGNNECSVETQGNTGVPK